MTRESEASIKAFRLCSPNGFLNVKDFTWHFQIDLYNSNLLGETDSREEKGF